MRSNPAPGGRPVPELILMTLITGWIIFRWLRG